MKIRIAIRKIPLITATALLLAVGFASATTQPPIATNNIQSLNGILLNIKNGFTVAQAYLFPTATDFTANNPCVWDTANDCNNAITANNWVLGVVVDLNTVPTTTTTYLIDVNFGAVIVLPGGQTASGNIVSFSVPPTATQGSFQLFLFDLGVTALPATTTMVILIK